MANLLYFRENPYTDLQHCSCYNTLFIPGSVSNGVTINLKFMEMKNTEGFPK